MTPRGDIVLATRNPGKLREIRQALRPLGVRVSCVDEFGEIDSPVEDGNTFAENARDKALYYARATGRWCLADDSGLQVDALAGQPGVFSARYAADECPPDAGRDCIDAANNARLMRLLEGVADEKRTARFVCHLALASQERVLLEASGTLTGRIARRPRGHNGFGYDPIFLLPDRGCTAAELTPSEKNAVSHRGNAVRQFAKLLENFLERGE